MHKLSRKSSRQTYPIQKYLLLVNRKLIKEELKQVIKRQSVNKEANCPEDKP
jgi:hypothetical protein